MAKHYCTNCSMPLTLNGKCPQCSQVNYTDQNKQCAFSYQGKRCPASGSISTSVKGDGRYYCASHFRSRDNWDESVKIMNEYLIHGVPIQKDWRDELIEKLNGVI